MNLRAGTYSSSVQRRNSAAGFHHDILPRRVPVLRKGFVLSIGLAVTRLPQHDPCAGSLKIRACAKQHKRCIHQVERWRQSMDERRMRAAANSKRPCGSLAIRRHGIKKGKQALTIPPICQSWRAVAGKLPRLTIGDGLDVSTMVASTLSLAALRFLAECILVKAFGWPSNSVATKKSAALCCSFLHATLVSLGVAGCFLSDKQYNPTEPLDDTPLWWQETVSALFQFCTGFMIYDIILNYIWLTSQMQGAMDPHTFLYLGHHLASILVMAFNQITNAGHQSTMLLMLVGEITDPLQSLYFILKTAQTLECCDGVSRTVYEAVRVSFALFFCLVRGGLAPLACGHVTLKLWLEGRKQDIHRALILVYVALIWAIQLGSIPWMITNCYSTLEEYGFPKLGILFEQF